MFEENIDWEYYTYLLTIHMKIVIRVSDYWLLDYGTPKELNS